MARFAERVLDAPRLFNASQRLLGGRESKRRFIEEHVRARPGDRVLDIGCGTGALRGLLPRAIAYLGVEINERYVRAARSRYGDDGEFVCADIGSFMLRADRRFDLAIAYGVFHHLSDETARRAVEIAADALDYDGRFLIDEPCWTPEQGRFETLLMRADRGRHVRTIDEYVALTRTRFTRVETELMPDTYRVPYTMVVVEARR